MAETPDIETSSLGSLPRPDLPEAAAWEIHSRSRRAITVADCNLTTVLQPVADTGDNVGAFVPHRTQESPLALQLDGNPAATHPIPLVEVAVVIPAYNEAE